MDGLRRKGGGLTFSPPESIGLPMRVRCGQCVGCRLAHARSWGVRIMHENQMHEESCFLTLTYDDEHLPENGSLCPEDHRLFVKRVRKFVVPRKVRYFHCGEYGEEGLRPHYHTILFGERFVDRVPCGVGPSGLGVFQSATLDDLWSHGRAVIGDVTFESAQYVAKYVTKKLTLSRASSREANRRYRDRYERVDPRTGEVVEVRPEYSTCSNRPGLGASWFARYHSDVFPHDHVIVKGREVPVPRYYEKLLERQDPELLKEVKLKRLLERDRSDDSEGRLMAMEKCANARLSVHGGRE